MLKAATALIAATLLAAPAARAQGTAPAPVPAAPAQQTNSHLAAAQHLYQKLDLDAALAELKEAEAQAKDNEDDTVQILVYRGLIMADLGKQPEMTELFKRALAIRPWAEVPPETSPRVLKAFADARRSLWGSGSSVKPPVKRAAVPAVATDPMPAVPAVATDPVPQAAPATVEEPPPPVPVPATQASPPAADPGSKDLTPPK